MIQLEEALNKVQTIIDDKPEKYNRDLDILVQALRRQLRTLLDTGVIQDTSAFSSENFQPDQTLEEDRVEREEAERLEKLDSDKREKEKLELLREQLRILEIITLSSEEETKADPSDVPRIPAAQIQAEIDRIEAKLRGTDSELKEADSRLKERADMANAEYTKLKADLQDSMNMYNALVQEEAKDR